MMRRNEMAKNDTVALVVDPTFGARLEEIAARMPVWIVDTPTNRPIAERHWQECPGQSHVDGVTTFSVDPTRPREEWCIGELPAIDLHHGEYSANPPYRAIQVYGVEPTERIGTAFAEYGMTNITKTADGFLASRPNVAA